MPDGPERKTPPLVSEHLALSEAQVKHVSVQLLPSLKRSVVNWLWLQVVFVMPVLLVAVYFVAKSTVSARVEKEVTPKLKEVAAAIGEFEDRLKSAIRDVSEAEDDVSNVKLIARSAKDTAENAHVKALIAARVSSTIEQQKNELQNSLNALVKREKGINRNMADLERLHDSLRVDVAVYLDELKRVKTIAGGLAQLIDETEKMRVARYYKALTTGVGAPNVLKIAIGEAGEDARLKKLGNKADVVYGLLVEKLKNRVVDSDIRAEAAWAVGNFGQRGINVLVEVRDDVDESLQVRVAATRALGNVGDEALNILLSRLNEWVGPEDEEEFEKALEIRSALVLALLALGDEALLDLITWALRDHDFRQPGSGISLWGMIGERAIPFLVAKLALDQPTAIRRLATRGLLKMAETSNDLTPAVEPLLITVQRDPIYQVCVGALDALGTIRADIEKVLPILIELADDVNEHPKVRESAIHAIGAYGSRATQATALLLQIFQNEANTQLGVAATRALARVGAADAGVMKALNEAASDEHHELSWAAKQALSIASADAPP